MQSRANLKRTMAAVVVGILVGGGITTVTPAGAEVAEFAATNWKKIWNKKLKQQADKRYYTKSASDAKYSTKTEADAALGGYYTKAQSDAALGGYYTKAQSDAALGGYYTKAQSDAAYAPKTQSYTKAESDTAYAPKTQSYTKAQSDAKYAPVPSLIRGTYNVIGYSWIAGAQLGDNLSFGWTLSAPPIAHYIEMGTATPAGCSGTAEAPNASPGHLCVFESQNVRGRDRVVIDAEGWPNVASTFGAGVVVTATEGGSVFVFGSWAVRPGTAVGPQGLIAGPGPAAGVGTRAGD